MLVGLSVAETLSWGVLYYSFSVFIRPIEREMGWSRTQVTGAFSLALLVAGLAAMPVGHWVDARGARGLMTSGSVLGALLLLALLDRPLPRGALCGLGGPRRRHGDGPVRARVRASSPHGSCASATAPSRS